MAESHVEFVKRGEEIVKNAPQLYIDLDVESDGWAGYGSLLSVGAVSPWGEQFYRELRPTSSRYIPANRQFCEDHGLEYDRLMDEGIDPALAMRDLSEWNSALRGKYNKVGKSVMVAFNASYDFPLVNLEYLRAGIENPFDTTGYCIQSLALALNPAYDWRSVSKKRLLPELLPKSEFAHNALQDAIWQQELHFAMVGKLIGQ